MTTGGNIPRPFRAENHVGKARVRRTKRGWLKINNSDDLLAVYFQLTRTAIDFIRTGEEWTRVIVDGTDRYKSCKIDLINIRVYLSCLQSRVYKN